MVRVDDRLARIERLFERRPACTPRSIEHALRLAAVVWGESLDARQLFESEQELAEYLANQVPEPLPCGRVRA